MFSYTHNVDHYTIIITKLINTFSGVSWDNTFFSFAHLFRKRLV